MGVGGAFVQALDRSIDQWRERSINLKGLLRLPLPDFASKEQDLLQHVGWKWQRFREKIQEGVLQ